MLSEGRKLYREDQDLQEFEEEEYINKGQKATAVISGVR